MRWISWFILAYLALGLQTGLEGFSQVRGASVNLVLLAAVFIGLSAPRNAALLGCFGLGLLQDLTTRQPLGLFAISYGLVALLLNPAQQAVNRDHPLTQFSATLFGGLMTATVLLVHDYFRPAAGRIVTEGGAVLPAVHLSVTNLLAGSLYTALLAPIALWILARVRRGFAFTPQRRKIRAWN
jgi:rod shape-determining protein MreD